MIETSENPQRKRNGGFPLWLSLSLVGGGVLLSLLGAVPQIIGLDRSPVIGFVQLAVFLVGLAVVSIGGYFSLTSLWNGHARTIAADIGLRLVSTGYVIAVACGMADIFGFGSHTLPNIPFFGPWQAGGVLVGEMFIAGGFLLMVPWRGEKPEPTTDIAQDGSDSTPA